MELDALPSGEKEQSFVRQSEALDNIDPATKEGLKRLRFITKYAPDAPPADASPALVELHATLKKEHAALAGDSDTTALLEGQNISPERMKLLTSVFLDYGDKLKDYEKQCIRSMYPTMLKKLGVTTQDPESFDVFLASLSVPLTNVPDQSDKRFSAEQRKALAARRENLEETRTGKDGRSGLLFALQDELTNLWAKYDVRSEKQWKEFGRTITQFVALRNQYEDAIRTAEMPPSMLAIYGGASAQAAAQTGIEMTQFGKEPLFLKGPDVTFMSELGVSTKEQLVKAEQKLQGMLRARGITKIPTLGEVIRTVNKTPLGTKMLRDMMEVSSPFTVLFYAYMLHESDNKLKATLDFAACMATSAASGAMLETVQLMLESERMAAIAGPRAAIALSKVAKIPGNFAVKFAVILAVMFLGHEQINEVTTWIDDNVLKKMLGTAHHGVGVGVSVFFGESLIGTAGYAAEEMGFSYVDPAHDKFKYLSTELATVEGWTEGGPSLDTRFVRNEQDWNEHVDSYTKNLGYNPLRRKLWELERIDGSWYEREAAHLYEDTNVLKKMETEIGTELTKRTRTRDGINGKETVPVLSNARMLNIAEDVTTDGGDKRVDRSLDMMLGIPDHPANRANTYVNGLKADDPLKQSWSQYLGLARRVAHSVTIYRNLKYAGYDRNRWLGNGKEMPQMVENGFVEELAHTMRKQQVLRSVAHDGSISRRDYGKSIGALVNPTPDKRKVLGMEVQSAAPAYSVRALSQATEAAASYLPESTDANVLFHDLQHLATSEEEIPPGEIRRLRDEFTDAVRREAEQTKSGEYTEASRPLKDAVGLSGNAKILSSIDVRDKQLLNDKIFEKYPRDQLIGMLLKSSFAEEMKKDQSEGATTFLCQCVIPENGLAILTLTSIKAEGPDQNEWRVKVHRHHISKQQTRGASHPFEQETEKGASEEFGLQQWSADHPQAAELLKGSLVSRQKSEQKKFSDHDKEIKEANKRADDSTDTFIEIPVLNQYRRKYENGTATLTRIPDTRTFRTTQETGFGPNPVEDYTLIVRRPDKPDLEIAINQRMISQLDKQPKDIQSIVRSVLTTPIELKEQASLAAVLNMFESGSSMPSNFTYAFGSRPEYYYQTLLQKLLPIYEGVTNKKYFLERLFDELQWRNGTISAQTTAHLSAWFKNNAELFNQGSAADCGLFEKGDRLLGYPDPEGRYKIMDGKNTTYFTFDVGAHEWVWCVDGKTWVSCKESYMPEGPNKYRSPSTTALRMIEQLRKKS